MTGQFIPTKVHAMEDYLTSAALPYVARKLGLEPGTRKIMDSVASIAGAQGMMTDYEGGMVRLLPMKAHLASDVVMGAGLLALASLLRGKPRVDRIALAALGAFTVVTALMTRPHAADRDDDD